MAAITTADLATELRRYGIDPDGTDNPMGQYGFRNVDYAAGMAMGFAEFKGDTASLPYGFDVVANRQLKPGSYGGAASRNVADIVTAQNPNQFNPFDTDLASPGGNANRVLGMNTAINQMLNQPTGLTGLDLAHANAIQAAMTGIWGDGSLRGITGGADQFVGGPGTYVNATMLGKLNNNGYVTAPDGESRFFNYNAPLGANDFGFGPPIGSRGGAPVFGPASSPVRPGELSPGQNTEPYDNYDRAAGDWLRINYPNHPDVQPTGKYYYDPNFGYGQTTTPTGNYDPVTGSVSGAPPAAGSVGGPGLLSPEDRAAADWLRVNYPNHADIQPGGKYYDPETTGSIGGGGGTAAGYPYGSGMDFGMPDITTEKGWLQVNYPNHPDLQQGGKYGTGTTGSINGGAASYPYGAGMDFGMPDITTEKGWLQVNYPNHPDLQQGGKYGPPSYPYGTGMGFGLGDPGFGDAAVTPNFDTTFQTPPASFSGDPATQTTGAAPMTEEAWLRQYAPDNAALQQGGKYYLGNTGSDFDYSVTAPSAASINGFDTPTGGFDPGDMGDAATTQGHTDYMNAARAAAAREAQYQAGVQAQRAATDASIASSAAQSNSWNPQYNSQTNFNQNIANLNNPLPPPNYSFL